jgi:hypothetical protein
MGVLIFFSKIFSKWILMNEEKINIRISNLVKTFFITQDLQTGMRMRCRSLFQPSE